MRKENVDEEKVEDEVKRERGAIRKLWQSMVRIC